MDPIAAKSKTSRFGLSWEKVPWPPILGILAPVIALLAVLFFPHHLGNLAGVITAHLPLTLPILMVLISIGAKVNELSSRQGWLDLCNYFSSGVVTFAIWALVSGESVKRYIWINPQKVLDKAYGVPLVVMAFGLMASCSLVTVLAKNGEEQKKLWQSVQGLFLGLSLLALLYPAALFESKATVETRTGKSLELRSFTVSIRYSDPSLDAHLGSTTPLQLCAVFRSIAAKTSDEAKDQAKRNFLQSEQSNQQKYGSKALRAGDRPTKKVPRESIVIVAEPDTSETGP